MYKRVRNTNAWIERDGSVVRLMSYDHRFKFHATSPYCFI